MHAWHIIAFVLAVSSAIVAAIGKQWALTLLAASLAFWLLPTALQLH